jgi:hemolysin III
MDDLCLRDPVSACTHFTWMVLALPGTLILWRLSRGHLLKRVGVLVFGLTLVWCYGGSALFHSVPAAMSAPYRTLDHIGIYLLIAGTVTPIGLVVLRGWWRIGLLSGIWALAATGITLRLTADMSISFMTVLYLFMGWIGCTMYFELVRRLSHSKVRLIVFGGIFYSVGAVINGLDWPNVAPSVFGAHELFHLFVMAGSLFHYYFMLRAVLPYEG